MEIASAIGLIASATVIQSNTSRANISYSVRLVEASEIIVGTIKIMKDLMQSCEAKKLFETSSRESKKRLRTIMHE